MATKYYVEYEHGVPQTGDMLVWDGHKWSPYKRMYETLTIDGDRDAVWDTKTGLYKKLTDGSGSFTLKLQNVENGMSGDFVYNNTSLLKPFPSMTILASGGGAVIPTILGNGSLSALDTGLHHICWVYDGTRITYNIAKYGDTF